MKKTINQLREKYDENEDCNCHAENYILLAEHFGSAEQIFYAKINLEYKEKFGFASSDLIAICIKTINPLYKNLR